MSEKLGDFLAQRYHTLYRNEAVGLRDELLLAVFARGYGVDVNPAFTGRGFCRHDPRTVLHLGPELAPRVIAHEVAEGWIHENFRWGVEYPPWEWDGQDTEAVCDEFADRVCEG